MKIESKDIVPFIDTIKALLSDYQNAFPELEDKEQCETTFDYVYEQLKTVITSFKLKHLTPILKPNERTLPPFVSIHNRQFDIRQESGEGNINISDYEEKMEFMSKLYFMIKRKLENDGVDHLLHRDKIYNHIYLYLVSNDKDWGFYFNTVLADAAYKVIDTVTDEILEYRRKHPQLAMELTRPEPKRDRRLIKNL